MDNYKGDTFLGDCGGLFEVSALKLVKFLWFYLVFSYLYTLKPKNYKIMKEKTVKQLATCHNRLARLHNSIAAIEDNDFTEAELKKLKKLNDQAFKLLLDFSDFKRKALTERGIEIPEVL